MNTNDAPKKLAPNLFPDHVGRSMNVHELVLNGKPSIQEGKEATGHTTGKQ